MPPIFAPGRSFDRTLDLTALALAKADLGIAAYYYRELVPPALRPLGDELRAQARARGDAVRAITGQADLLVDNAVLRRSIDVRNPYVIRINLIQGTAAPLRAAGSRRRALPFDPTTTSFAPPRA